MAPIQEGGAATSSDVAVAEPLPNAAEAGRVSQEAVPIEQGQPLRAVEPDEWATKVRAKPIRETPTHRQRKNHEFTHLPAVLWCPACVCGKAADDPHRRRQDARDSGLDVASFDHCDISAEVGMFIKKLKFEVLVSHWSGAAAALGGPKDVTEHVVRFVCGVLETWGCQDKVIQDSSEKHAQVFEWQFGSLRISHQRGGKTDPCNVVSNVR